MLGIWQHFAPLKCCQLYLFHQFMTKARIDCAACQMRNYDVQHELHRGLRMPTLSDCLYVSLYVCQHVCLSGSVCLSVCPTAWLISVWFYYVLLHAFSIGICNFANGKLHLNWIVNRIWKYIYCLYICVSPCVYVFGLALPTKCEIIHFCLINLCNDTEWVQSPE